MNMLGSRRSKQAPGSSQEPEEIDLLKLSPQQYAAEMRRRKTAELDKMRAEGRAVAEAVRRQSRLIEYSRYGLKVVFLLFGVAFALFGHTGGKNMLLIDTKRFLQPTGVAVWIGAAWLAIFIGISFFLTEWRSLQQQRKEFERQVRQSPGDFGGQNPFARMDNSRHSDTVRQFWGGMTCLFVGGGLAVIVYWAQIRKTTVADQHIAYGLSTVCLALIFLFVCWDMNRIILQDYTQEKKRQRELAKQLAEAEAEELRMAHEALQGQSQQGGGSMPDFDMR